LYDATQHSEAGIGAVSLVPPTALPVHEPVGAVMLARSWATIDVSVREAAMYVWRPLKFECAPPAIALRLVALGGPPVYAK
jgi:hypothetical protein